MAPRIPKQNAHFINSEAESSRGRSALEAMRGYAGAPSQASVMYPGSQQGYEAGELAGMAEMLIPGASMAKGALGAMLAGVIKPRGGNWIPGDVESSISNLLRREDSRLQHLQRTTLEMARQQGYDNNMIERLVLGLQQRDAPTALNRWIEGPLTKYIKRDMATPEDPVRRLADEGILHMGIPQTVGVPSRGIQGARRLSGFPEEGLSTTPGGSLWENLSDRVVGASPARYLQDDPKVIAENPWMQKLDPESVVYSTPSHIERGLGLDHLVDELSNAMNPGSGLPRNLLLRPEQMQQMGMEKAVRHVDAINKWRAAQQAAANAELANKGLIVREYAENNPKGLRWMELKASDDLPEGWSVQKGPEGKDIYVTPEGKMTLDHPRAQELEKQLKYEGDTMGHCVGGYCPDVLEGKSRIFSLRDAKGEPHVTVEVGPGLKPDFESLVDQAYRSGDHSRFEREFDRINGIGAYELLDRQMLEEGMGEDLWDFTQYALERHPETMVRWAQPSIKQVKGKQNLAPKDEYLPFVQDFVRNSPLGNPWGQVEDLKNTGLRKVGDRYVTPDELKDVPKTADGLPIGYQPLDDRPEWKDGGLVAQPDYFDDLDAFLGR
jgi:hypothetical protein